MIKQMIWIKVRFFFIHIISKIHNSTSFCVVFIGIPSFLVSRNPLGVLYLSFNSDLDLRDGII